MCKLDISISTLNSILDFERSRDQRQGSEISREGNFLNYLHGILDFKLNRNQRESSKALLFHMKLVLNSCISIRNKKVTNLVTSNHSRSKCINQTLCSFPSKVLQQLITKIRENSRIFIFHKVIGSFSLPVNLQSRRNLSCDTA